MNNNTRKVEEEGKVYVNNKGLSFEVIEYINNKHVLVRFVSSGYKSITNMNAISKGITYDKTTPTVKDIGTIGDVYKPRDNRRVFDEWCEQLGEHTPEEYRLYTNFYEDKLKQITDEITTLINND